METRFHRAARDGFLHVLKEATKKDCNHQDEDGVSPTLWAAFEGNLEALRLIVGRGGNPGKCDIYGNTPLHYAAARGHLSCVSFLINFGVNIWSLDNDFHSAKDLAAINNKLDILKFLDSKQSLLEKEDLKKSMKLQSKSKKDAEKRQKEFAKIQKKANKKRTAEDMRIKRNIEKITEQNNRNPLILLSRPKQPVVSTNSPTYSELTHNSATKKTMSAIQRKILNRKSQTDSSKSFKTGLSSDLSKRSMRSLAGLQIDSDVMFVSSGSTCSSSDSSTTYKKLPIPFLRGKQDTLYRTRSVPNIYDVMSSFNQSKGSLFDRPGFGSVAFRNSICSTLRGSPGGSVASSENSYEEIEKLMPSQNTNHYDYILWEENDSNSEEESNPLYLFLSTTGIQNYMSVFLKEEVDLDALMLLTDSDLETMNIPLGPRRKLLKAIEERTMALQKPGKIRDIKL